MSEAVNSNFYFYVNIKNFKLYLKVIKKNSIIISLNKIEYVPVVQLDRMQGYEP